MTDEPTDRDATGKFTKGNRSAMFNSKRDAARTLRHPASTKEKRWMDRMRKRLRDAGYGHQRADTLSAAGLTRKRTLWLVDELYATDKAAWARMREDEQEAIDFLDNLERLATEGPGRAPPTPKGHKPVKTNPLLDPDRKG